MGLGQYNSLGEYCDPHTASSVFLILLYARKSVVKTLQIDDKRIITGIW